MTEILKKRVEPDALTRFRVKMSVYVIHSFFLYKKPSDRDRPKRFLKLWSF